jgi:hypothetical protein
MKALHFSFVVLAAGLIFLLAKPVPLEVQLEEAPYQFVDLKNNHYRLIMEITHPDDLQVADILWYQYAAEFAIERNNPWFNARELKIVDGGERMEGIIELEKDPTNAEHDANEILSLHLSDEFQEN